MRKNLLLFVFTILSTLTASAYDAQINSIYYNLDTSTKTATVTYKDNNYNSYTGSVSIPKTVTYEDVTYSVASIVDLAFVACEGLTSITIPNSVTSIGDWAFAACEGLTSITIPNSVTFIGFGVFQECPSLISVIVNAGNTRYDSRDNCNAIIETATNSLINGCVNTVIPNSVTSIGEGAFSWCSGLTSVTIPNSVTSINNVAFQGCSDLASVTIGSGVTSIGDFAFSNCSGLTSVACEATEVPSTGGAVFNNVPQSSATLYVPASALEDYKTTAPWSGFGTIVALPDGDIRGDVNGDGKVDMDDVKYLVQKILNGKFPDEE